MTEQLTPDFGKTPDPRAPEYPALATQWLAGTYSSGWPQLKQATFSALQAAAYGTGVAFNTCQRIAQGDTHRAEKAFLADINYSMAVFGPCLGGLVLSAFALESFVRLGYVIALEIRSSRSRTGRTRGFSPLIEAQLSEFEGVRSRDRIRLFRRVVGFPVDRQKEDLVGKLIDYRNSIAHDAPVLWTIGADLKATDKRYRRRRENVGPFEEITSSTRPVRLKHLIKAIRIHDDFVTHTLETAKLKGWALQLRKLGGPWATIADSLPGTKLWKQARELAKAWENGPERELRASPAEEFEFREQLIRRLKVKTP